MRRLWFMLYRLHRCAIWELFNVSLFFIFFCCWLIKFHFSFLFSSVFHPKIQYSLGKVLSWKWTIFCLCNLYICLQHLKRIRVQSLIKQWIPPAQVYYRKGTMHNCFKAVNFNIPFLMFSCTAFAAVYVAVVCAIKCTINTNRHKKCIIWRQMDMGSLMCTQMWVRAIHTKAG